MSNIYALDDHLAGLLKLDNFQGKFDVAGFVEALSKRQIATQKAHPEEIFSPKPLIRDFETALEQLNSMKGRLSGEIDDTAQRVKAAELAHNKKVRLLNQKFETVVGAFETLEEMITSVGTTAIQIGKSLDALSAQLTRAQASTRVATTYLALRDNEKALSDVRRRKMSLEEAKFVRNLLQICRDVDIDGAERTSRFVEKFSEQVERDVLADFDAAYREGDTTTMARCATILSGFNGGASVHRAFVNQHDFFIRRERIESEDVLGSDEIWQLLPDPDETPPGLEPSLVTLFRDIRKCIKDEFIIINHIFPEPVTVKNMFLQRVFNQSIQSRLEDILSYAENTSTLAYLRTLQATYSIVEIIVENIKNLQSSTSEEVVAITAVLETQRLDLFVPYVEGGRYLEKERKSLTELYSSVLYKFTRYHNDKRDRKITNYFDKVIGKMSVGRDEGRVGALFRLAGLERTNSVRDGRDARNHEDEPLLELTDSDGLLKTSQVNRMLKWHAEAIGRSVELTSGMEIPRDALSLMSLLYDFVSRDYLETWLDRALDDLIAAEPRIEPDFACFPGIKEATTISRLLYSYVETVLVPLAGTNLSIRREMQQRQQSNTNRIDGKVNALIQRTIDAILTWFASILARQKKMDFKPREEDMMNIASMQTQTNIQAQGFLFKVGQIAQQSLSGGNLEAFLTEVGSRVHYQLLDHYKKFSVSAAGGLLLTKDITKLQETVSAWNIESLDMRFKILHEIGNVFVVKPDVLRALITEGELSRLKPQVLVPYLQSREDYYNMGLSRLLVNTEQAQG